MQLTTALTDAILAFACLACTLATGKARKGYAENLQPALFCALLGFLLPAAAASAGAIRYSVDPGAQTLHIWLTQASTFLGFPLLGIAAVTISQGLRWSRATWGRILLGLCAFYELFRQMNYLEDYRVTLSLATLLLILYAGIRQWPHRSSLLSAVLAVTLFAVAGLAVGTQGLLGSLHRVDLFHILLSFAYPLLLWLLIGLANNAQRPSSEEIR